MTPIEIIRLRPARIVSLRENEVGDFDVERLTLIVPDRTEEGREWWCKAMAGLRRHDWDLNPVRPTFHPSIGVWRGDKQIWHGFVIDGRMSTNLKALKAAAGAGALSWYGAQK